MIGPIIDGSLPFGGAYWVVCMPVCVWGGIGVESHDNEISSLKTEAPNSVLEEVTFENKGMGLEMWLSW